MKTKLLITLTAVLLFLMPNGSFGQSAPNLGVTSSFALFTAVGSFDNTGATVITGDVGTNVGAFTGFPIPGTIVGTTHVVDPTSIQAAIDVDVAYSDLFSRTCGIVLGTTLGNNQVLTPNTYCLGGASSLNGDLILDAEDDPNALFIIKIDGALSTSTFSNIVLINSASMCNVYWQINGKFELGENSVFRGTVIANGDIMLLEGAALYGRGLSREGAISLHNNVVSAVMNPIASVITANGATTICTGGSVVLSGNVGGTWSNGAKTASITVSTAGDYYVNNTNACGLVTSNHIVVKISPALTASVITANKTTTFCAGGNVILSGNVGGTWSNGAKTSSTTITTSGDYYVTTTNACGSVTSNHIVVTVNPKATASVISASSATTICVGSSVTLTGNVGGTWSNGATTATTTVTTAGDYYVTNTNACGAVTSNHIVVKVNAAVVASVITAAGTTTFCKGGSVILAGNVGGTWSNGATTATTTVTAAGDYYVTNTNACGSITSNHIAVTVNPLAVASVITAATKTALCVGESVVLSGNVGGTWSNGATTASITVSAAGDYFVSNTNTCGSVTSNHIAVTVTPAVVASVITANGSVALCDGNSIVLAGNVGGTWSNGATTATITVATAGNYYVTNTNACGTVTSNHLVVTVSAAPIANTGNNATICVGNSVTLGTTAIAGHTYSWSPATGLSSATVSNPVATPTVTTTYTLTETITASGCVAINAVKVTVGGVPTISTSACIGGSVSFSATATGTDVTYQWRKGTVNLVDGGNIYGATSATLTISPVTLADASSNYNVVVTGSCATSVTPLSISLVVFGAPVIVSAPVSQTPCVGTSTSFSVVASGIGLTYQWRKGTVNLSNGGHISGATSAKLTINSVSASDVASNYNVVVTGACSTVTSTSANASLALCSYTGTPALKVGNPNDVVSIYPNPSKASINIELVDAAQTTNPELKLYDALGAMVINKSLTDKTTTLNTNNFPSGIYFYKVFDNDKTVQSGKLIFQQ